MKQALREDEWNEGSNMCLTGFPDKDNNEKVMITEILAENFS